MGKSTWTYEQCCEEARKYKTKIEFRNNSRRAYDAAYRHNWMKDFTWFEEIINRVIIGHMNVVIKKQRNINVKLTSKEENVERIKLH